MHRIDDDIRLRYAVECATKSRQLMERSVANLSKPPVAALTVQGISFVCRFSVGEWFAGR